MLRKCVLLLKNRLAKKFPDIKVGFYLSWRSNFVHIGVDVLTVKWKFEYIILRKKKMNPAKHYVIQYVPDNLKLYERGGLLTGTINANVRIF